MKLLYYHIILIFSACAALTLTACSDRSDLNNLFVEEKDSSEVTLTLHVSVSNVSDASSTRADEPTYVSAIDKYEKIHTLRVIILREDKTVEYNRLATLPEGESTDRFGNLDFKVSTSQGTINYEERICIEKKRIYLIANEDAIEPTWFLNEFRNLKVGTKLDRDIVTEWIIYNDWASSTTPEGAFATPFIDNEGEKKSYIPMTEYFDIDVVADLANAGKEQVQEESMFLTRNFIKFQFSVQSESASVNVTGIKFVKLMQKEYLFPRVVYSPDKTDLDATNREIISFETPAAEGNLIRPYVFKPENFQFTLPSGNEQIVPAVYSPRIYFCETKILELKDGKPDFQVGIDVEFLNPDGTKDEAVTYPPQQLNNLPDYIPRNSIVKVDMTLKNGILNCITTVLPYTGVWLNPSFGIDRKDEEE